jgi:hypothetical protein
MISSVFGLVGNIVGGLLKHLPTIGAFFYGKKVAESKQQKEALKAKRKAAKVRDKNKQESTSGLLKKQESTSGLLKKLKKHQRRSD